MWQRFAPKRRSRVAERVSSREGSGQVGSGAERSYSSGIGSDHPWSFLVVGRTRIGSFISGGTADGEDGDKSR